MVADNAISLPHRRAHESQTDSPTTSKIKFSKLELGSWSSLIERHRFLLTAITLLTCLCTVYLYFAITLGNADDDNSCAGLTGAQKMSCKLQLIKALAVKGKTK